MNYKWMSPVPLSRSFVESKFRVFKFTTILGGTLCFFPVDIFQDNFQAKSKLKTILDYRCQILTEIIAEAKNNGVVVDVRPQDLSMLIIGFLRLAILNWRLNNFQDSLKDRVNQMIETIDKLIFI